MITINMIDDFGDPKAGHLFPLFPNVDGRLHGYISVIGLPDPDAYDPDTEQGNSHEGACYDQECYVRLTNGREATDWRLV